MTVEGRLVQHRGQPVFPLLRTFCIVLAQVLENLDMARHLLARADLLSLAHDVERNELIATAGFAIDVHFATTELWNDTQRYCEELSLVQHGRVVGTDLP